MVRRAAVARRQAWQKPQRAARREVTERRLTARSVAVGRWATTPIRRLPGCGASSGRSLRVELDGSVLTPESGSDQRFIDQRGAGLACGYERIDEPGQPFTYVTIVTLRCVECIVIGALLPPHLGRDAMQPIR